MLNTDLNDLSDVTDEAIETALQAGGKEWHTTVNVRFYAKEGEAWAEYCILLARCIQAHYPEMLVDPVTAKAREIARDWLTSAPGRTTEDLAREAILAGMAMERGK